MPERIVRGKTGIEMAYKTRPYRIEMIKKETTRDPLPPH